MALAVNILLIGLAQRLPLLTRAGWVHAGALGSLLWGCLGPRGWLAVVLYLALGSLVTRLGFRTKQARGLAEARGGARGPENVWGSAASGALLAMAAALAPRPLQPLLLLGFAASFAAKLADTCGSEIGKRWGRHTVLITTLKPVPPGTEGAISLEGSAASLLGSALMAALMAALGLISGRDAWLLVTLVGLVAKNAILVTEFANQLQHQGLAKLEAIRTAAHVRLRPILMTTLATVVGHFPLVLVSGAGAEARNSIGIILVAGMLIGSLFTLFILPCLYLVLGDNLQAHADAEPSPPLTPAEAR